MRGIDRRIRFPNPRIPHLRSVAKSVALSFLWVPAFAGMTARFAKVSSTERTFEGYAAGRPPSQTALTLPLPVIPANAGIQRINRATDS